jgi:hypothetical protein
VLVIPPGLAGVILQGDLAAFLQDDLQVDAVRVAGQAIQRASGNDGDGWLAVPGEDLRDRIRELSRP